MGICSQAPSLALLCHPCPCAAGAPWGGGPPPPAPDTGLHPQPCTLKDVIWGVKTPKPPCAFPWVHPGTQCRDELQQTGPSPSTQLLSQQHQAHPPTVGMETPKASHPNELPDETRAYLSSKCPQAVVIRGACEHTVMLTLTLMLTLTHAHTHSPSHSLACIPPSPPGCPGEHPITHPSRSHLLNFLKPPRFWPSAMAVPVGGRGDQEGQVYNREALPCLLLPSCPPSSQSLIACSAFPPQCCHLLPAPRLSLPALPLSPWSSQVPVFARTRPAAQGPAGPPLGPWFGDAWHMWTPKTPWVPALEEGASPMEEGAGPAAEGPPCTFGAQPLPSSIPMG